eukprot:364509-Chlamydomonas_euryale.AAC.11
MPVNQHAPALWQAASSPASYMQSAACRGLPPHPALLPPKYTVLTRMTCGRCNGAASLVLHVSKPRMLINTAG